MSEHDDEAREDLPQAWSYAEGFWDEVPAIVGVRTGLDEWIADPTLPERIEVTWTYKESDEEGFPMANDSEAMQEFENRLSDCVETPAVAILTAVVTRKGTREWIFYGTKIEEFMALLNEEFARDPDFPIEIARIEDGRWEQYRELAGSLTGETGGDLDDSSDDEDDAADEE